MDIADTPGASGTRPIPVCDALQGDDGWWGLEAAIPFLLPALPDLADGPAAAA